ncbi:MAG: hypothetical protein GY833_22375 [Aestuariibacter sp.]|nr:hypothetical protein [Aestuariibacter sp.]
MELPDFKRAYSQLKGERPTQQIIADITGYELNAVKNWTRLNRKVPVPDPAKIAMGLYIEKLKSSKSMTLAVLDAVGTGKSPVSIEDSWDKGEAFFSHLKKLPINSYDGRDCFPIDSAQEVVQKLVELDPSEFVARSYVTALMNSVMPHVRFPVNKILYDSACAEWLSHFKALHEHQKEVCGDELSMFISKVTSYMKDKSIEVPTNQDIVAKLLVDALYATDMQIDWLYAYEGEPMPVRRYSNQLYLFPSMDVLEREVISGKLPYGVHICGVKIQGQFGRPAAANMIVCNTPNRGFVLSNMNFSFSMNDMESRNEDRMQSSYWVSPTTHYPSWKNEDDLPCADDAYPYAFGNIASLSGEQALWAYMTMELAVMRCLQVEPTGRSVSLKLLEAVSDDSVRTTLPAVWTKPFDPTLPTIAQMLETLEGHPNYKWMASLFDGLSDEVLLPDVEALGFDVRARKAIPETYDHEKSSEINRYGNSATPVYGSVQPFTINLYPRPTGVFGNEAAVNKALTKIATENFNKLLGALMRADWQDNADEINKWFAGALKRRFDKVMAFRKRYADTWFLVPRKHFKSLHRRQPISGIYEQYQPVSLADGDLVSDRYCPISMPRIGHYDSATSTHKGFKSKRKPKNEYYVNPMNTQDLMDMFDYKRSQLPKPLRHWHKTKLGGWGHHDMTAWIFE